MNQPAAGVGGGAAFGGAIANPTPKVPKMDDEQLRLRCVELAIQIAVDAPGATEAVSVIETAMTLNNYVKSGS